MTARRVEARLLSKGDIVLTPQGDKLLVRQCVVGAERVALLFKSLGSCHPERRVPFSVPKTCRFMREFKAV